MSFEALLLTVFGVFRPIYTFDMVASPARKKKLAKSVTYQIDQPVLTSEPTGARLTRSLVSNKERTNSWATGVTAALWLCSGVALAVVYAQILKKAEVC